MKKIFLLMFGIGVATNIYAIEVKEKANNYPYFEHIITTGLSIDNMKAQVINWAQLSESRTTLNYSDSGESVIVTGTTWISKGQMGLCPVTFDFTMNFEFRDGRYKCATTVNKVTVQDGNLPRYLDRTKYYADKRTSAVEKDIETFHKKIQQWFDNISKVSTTNNEDW